MKPPLLFRVVLLLILVIFGLLALLYLGVLLYGKDIAEMLQQYPEGSFFTRGTLTAMLISVIVLHGVAMWGLVWLWKLRRTGYYLFAIPALLLVLTHLFRPGNSLTFGLVYLVLLLLPFLWFRKTVS